MTKATALKQRADYTHKHNSGLGRHGWLRLTPAYSVKVVNEIFTQKAAAGANVLDPFCGTGTTALCAAYHGHDATTVDVNPFLVWLAGTKTRIFSSAVLERALAAGEEAAKVAGSKNYPGVAEPAIFNIERWWSARAITFLCRLRAAIDAVSPVGSHEHSLLLVAFCRTVIATSNASFNHQSMSFKETDTTTKDRRNYAAQFIDDLQLVLEGAEISPQKEAAVIHGDSKALHASNRKFDLVVTSPPYANRMSYIRELRPYMYWLGYLVNAREAGELDWKAIGGTWGIATSRLMTWEQNPNNYMSPRIPAMLNAISHQDNKNGPLLAAYIAKYFDDMWSHFESLTRLLSRGAHVHYIVGNSTFYGTLVPTEAIYADQLAELGFRDIQVKAIRKRNSKKELVEFDVSGIYGG